MVNVSVRDCTPKHRTRRKGLESKRSEKRPDDRHDKPAECEHCVTDVRGDCPEQQKRERCKTDAKKRPRQKRSHGSIPSG